jgi:hypothetical protein
MLPRPSSPAEKTTLQLETVRAFTLIDTAPSRVRPDALHEIPLQLTTH